MKVLIAGASGLVGGHLLSFLLKDKSITQVVSLGRRDLDISDEKLDQIIFDFTDEKVYQSLPKVGAIFCCLGTTIKKAGSQEKFKQVDYQYPLQLAQWGKANDVKSYSIVTALGANSKSRIFYNKVKGEIEDQLKRLDFETLSIFQPSLLLGDRKENRFGEKVGTLFMKAFNPLMRGSLRKYRGIQAKTVAKAMIKTFHKSEKGTQVLLSDEVQVVGKESE